MKPNDALLSLVAELHAQVLALRAELARVQNLNPPTDGSTT